MVFMFELLSTYLKTRVLSCCFYIYQFLVRETKTQLPLNALKKVWGEAVSYICGLREDYSRLFQGQRAAMYVKYMIACSITG